MTDSGSGPARRVLFILFGLDRAGLEVRMLQLARTVPKRIEMHFAVVGHDLTLLPEFLAAGAHVLHVPIGRAYLEGESIARIRLYVEQHGITLVNSFDMKTLIVALRVRNRRKRVRVVHHLISLWDDISALNQFLSKTLMRAADQLVCNGSAVRDVLLGPGMQRTPVEVIPNGVDLRQFKPSAELRRIVRDALQLREDEVVFGTVSNIRPVKNIPALIRAFARLPAASKARLVCVGGGPGLPDARAAAEAAGVTQRVTFVGAVDDVHRYLCAFDHFVLPSLSEGNPNVLLQAMATGVPVVASAVGEIPYLLDQGARGVLVPPGDEEALYVAMRHALIDVERTTRARVARDAAESLYSGDEMVRRYVALFDRLSAAPASSAAAA